PNLMPLWKKVTVKFIYQERVIELSLKGEQLTLALLSGEPCSLTVEGKRVVLKGKTTKQIKGYYHE
ncbi:MAG: hypothetical protein K2N74_01145, partial [Clostridiales bacterium]|nr:hypothetical protein [Clostridiales bacterium]